MKIQFSATQSRQISLHVELVITGADDMFETLEGDGNKMTADLVGDVVLVETGAGDVFDNLEGDGNMTTDELGGGEVVEIGAGDAFENLDVDGNKITASFSDGGVEADGDSVWCVDSTVGEGDGDWSI